ncbi:hypothetical protein BD626DRAFT_378956, partial [Schizophyllum amplum]
PDSTKPHDRTLRVNTFMQSWKPYKYKLPRFMRNLTDAAERWGLRLEGIAFGREILRGMIMWYHSEASPQMRRLAAFSNATKCLKERHKAMTVGDFESIASKRSEPTHQEGKPNCQCDTCEAQRQQVGCKSPDACYARAEQFLNTLPTKWDPRGEHPEDYEKHLEPRKDDEWTYFDRRVTVSGHVSNAFRIFTTGNVCNDRWQPLTEDEEWITAEAATDGSCMYNGERNARAGAGVKLRTFAIEEEKSIRLPPYIEQSNQSGEMVAAKAA